MNFFAHQAKARSNTTKLVVLFALAILGLILMTQVIVLVAFAWFSGIAVSDTDSFMYAINSLGSTVFFGIALTIITIVALAWLYKAAQLSSGGKAVAEALNGIRIQNGTEDLDERKILNVVEEMAIASGTSVPPVYLIEEPGINAFAAGYTARDAVIGVTRGCIRGLNRDELQGVVAHEFSHIFNGDMRLNIKLISVLHGILVIGLIGRTLMRSTSRGRSYSSRNSKGVPQLALLGLGLMFVGYLGTLFGGIIKAAVSRQREFLADASAVQYTRNPDSIANALKKIGGYPLGSYVKHPEANEISHMFFNQAINIHFAGFMATHPPLEERIKRIEPRWRGEFIKVTLPEAAKINPHLLRESRQGIKIDPDAYKKPEPAKKLEPIDYLGALAVAAMPTPVLQGSSMLEFSGILTPQHVEAAQELLQKIPDQLKNLAHDTYDVQALIYCFLLDKNRSDVHEQQLTYLENNLPADIYREVVRIKNSVTVLPPRHRLPLMNIAIGTLKQLSMKQYVEFKTHMMAMIKADKVIDLTEWSLYRMVTHHLEDKVSGRIGHKSLPTLHRDCQRLLSAIALASSDELDDANKCFQRAWTMLNLAPAELMQECLRDTPALDHALKRVNLLHPLKKPLFIKACCAALHQQDDPEGIELIRTMVDGLDAPMPPLLANQTLS